MKRETLWKMIAVMLALTVVAFATAYAFIAPFETFIDNTTRATITSSAAAGLEAIGATTIAYSPFAIEASAILVGTVISSLILMMLGSVVLLTFRCSDLGSTNSVTTWIRTTSTVLAGFVGLGSAIAISTETIATIYLLTAAVAVSLSAIGVSYSNSRHPVAAPKKSFAGLFADVRLTTGVYVV